MLKLIVFQYLFEIFGKSKFLFKFLYHCLNMMPFKLQLELIFTYVRTLYVPILFQLDQKHQK